MTWSNAFAHDLELRPVPVGRIRAGAAGLLLVPAIALTAAGAHPGTLAALAGAAGLAFAGLAGGTGTARLVLRGDGSFRLGATQRDAERAVLTAGWLIPGACGLLLATGTGGRRAVWLRAGDQTPDAWRRLRVRLRLGGTARADRWAV